MSKLIVPQVTHESSDQEIFHAINVAGQHKYSWREHDHAEPGESNQLSWVIPGDIGYSTEKDTRLLERLKALANKGSLEIQYTYRSRNVSRPDCAPRYTSCPTYPRFRVIKS